MLRVGPSFLRSSPLRADLHQGTLRPSKYSTAPPAPRMAGQRLSSSLPRARRCGFRNPLSSVWSAPLVADGRGIVPEPGLMPPGGNPEAGPRLGSLHFDSPLRGSHVRTLNGRPQS